MKDEKYQKKIDYLKLLKLGKNYIRFIGGEKAEFEGAIYQIAEDKIYLVDAKGQKRIISIPYIKFNSIQKIAKPKNAVNIKCLEEKITKKEETDENKDRKEDDEDIREADKFLKKNKDEFEMLSGRMQKGL